jgi:hypothetical protein
MDGFVWVWTRARIGAAATVVKGAGGDAVAVNGDVGHRCSANHGSWRTQPQRLEWHMGGLTQARKSLLCKKYWSPCKPWPLASVSHSDAYSALSGQP